MIEIRIKKIEGKEHSFEVILEILEKVNEIIDVLNSLELEERPEVESKL